jgi:hypothetical protein
MGIGVLILGESGTGKSASLRNFTKEEAGVINVVGKPLPFRSDITTFHTDNYMLVEQALKKSKLKTMVIDDSQYLLANEFMKRSGEKGFDKFTDIAKNFWTLIDMVQRELPEDMIVYFLHHTERDANGNEKAKTIGKMLDEKITLEGLFAICLKTSVEDGHYYFKTRNSGHDTVKTPMGMFADEKIENDLKAVDTTIREYYGMNKKETKKNA